MGAFATSYDLQNCVLLLFLKSLCKSEWWRILDPEKTDLLVAACL